MRLRTPTVLLLTLPFFAASCGSDSERNATGGDAAAAILHVYRSESFDGWVLDSAAAYATYQTHPAVMEPLVRFASDGFGVEPGLAESWVYDADSFTWTFTLRPDVRFSNGEPVTSDDVVFSFGIWSTGINFGGSFDRIVDAVALDERTVRFVLAAPGNTVPALLSGSIAGVMPADFAGMTPDGYYAAPIGAGPYVVNDWSSGGRIKLGRNPYYYASDRPFFDQIVIDVVSSDTELAILFESGQADIVNNVAATAVSQYAASGIVVTPASQVSHLSLNVRAPPFDDVNVRRAVASALDYDGIVDGPFEGYANLPNGFLPPNLAHWAPASTPYYSTDVAAARALLHGSTHAGGFAVELIYDAAIGVDTLIAQIVQANLAAIGIDVRLTGLETLAFLDRAFSLDADMLVWSYGAVSPDISDPLGWISGTQYLFTGYDRVHFEENQTAYLTTTSPEVKRRAVVAIQDEALEQAAVIALAEYSTLHAVATDLTGFAPAPWGLYYFDSLRRGSPRQ